jgi:hypothetical protein
MAGSVSGLVGTQGILFFEEKKKRGEKFYYAVVGVLHIISRHPKINNVLVLTRRLILVRK